MGKRTASRLYFFLLFFFLFFFLMFSEMGFHVPLADLELATQSRIILNSRSPCLSLPNSGMKRNEWHPAQAEARVLMASLLCLQRA